MLKPDCDQKSFIQAQKDEFDFELGGTEDLSKSRFVVYEGLLYRLGRPLNRPALSASGNKQTVVPTKYRETVLSLAHEHPFAGHIGICKTFQKVTKRFWWPGMKSSVKKYVAICETCQVMGKPNQGVPRVLLHQIPSLGEPFSELVVDVIGPLPRTKTGFVYVLTIMDRASRYPEAIPKWKITSRAIFDKIIDFFQGVAPFDLVFGHKIRGPLEIFHKFLESREVIDQSVNEVLDNLKSKLSVAGIFAKENLASAQGKMKAKYDKKCKVRSFEPGDLVLVLGTGLGDFLEPRFEGPWRVLRKLSEANYEIEAPGTRRKCRVFHINRLKSYSCGSVEPKRVPLESVATILDSVDYFEEDELYQVFADALNTNFQSLELLETGLKHLEAPQRENILNLLMFFSNSWQNFPGRTGPLAHDVDIGDALPVRQSPYRLNPEKRAFVEKEIKYTLEHNLIHPSISPWSSPVVLVKKPDDGVDIYIDYLVVHSDDWQTHVRRLKRVFKVLLVAGFVVNLKKCEFEKTKEPFIIAVDASDVGIGRVLFQRGNNGIVRPVSYYSHKLLAAERKYSTIEKDALALVRTLVHSKAYVTNFSFPVEIWTDNNPLVFIERMKGANQMILRCALELQEFPLVIKHVRGVDNYIPDTLS
ncbi:uncharacterized protein [Palaemon carinicauda]|uniref:uncharacterized protein n=1 Tax=Palaemon carinicauda TaxID=392227 RepID=UPI0035B68BB8